MSIFVSSAVMLDAALLLSGLQSLAEPHGTAGSFQPLQCCPPHPQTPTPIVPACRPSDLGVVVNPVCASVSSSLQ